MSKILPAKVLSKIGYTPKAPDVGGPNRTIATQSRPASTNQGKAESRSRSDTYFTKADGKTYDLYTGERQWARVTLTLETAGPVAVGMDANLGAPTSGTGVLLQTGVPKTFNIAKGTRLYIASSSVNRVSRDIEAVPWLEQIFAALLGGR